MPTNILMPALSPTMEKGNLAKWLKKEGDKVKSGDVIAEIETDKATMEVEAVDEGTLAKIVVPEGTQDVPVNDVIAVLAADGEDVKLPKDSSVTQMAEKTKLELLTGETFDKSYIKNQIKAHRETIALLKKEIASGMDPQAKSFASDVLPTVEGHLAKIRQIAADEGVTK